MVNRLVIIIKNKEEKTWVMIDVAFTEDKNISRKKAGKKVKIHEFMLQRICNMKNMIIPVITGATGIVTKVLKKNLEAVLGKHSIDSLQKTALLGSSHTVRKVLQSET
jgi:hypothetical protein